MELNEQLRVTAALFQEHSPVAQ